MKKALLIIWVLFPFILWAQEQNFEISVDVIQHEVCPNEGQVKFIVEGAGNEGLYFLLQHSETIMSNRSGNVDGNPTGRYEYVIPHVPNGIYDLSITDLATGRTSFHRPDKSIVVLNQVLTSEFTLSVNNNVPCERRKLTVTIENGNPPFEIEINKMDPDNLETVQTTVFSREPVSMTNDFPVSFDYYFDEAEPNLTDIKGNYQVCVYNICGNRITKDIKVTTDDSAVDLQITNFEINPDRVSITGNSRASCNGIIVNFNTSSFIIEGSMGISAAVYDGFIESQWEYNGKGKSAWTAGFPKSMELIYEEGTELEVWIRNNCSGHIEHATYILPDFSSTIEAYPVAYFEYGECLDKNSILLPAGIQLRVVTNALQNYLPCNILPLHIAVLKEGDSQEDEYDWTEDNSVLPTGNPVLHIKQYKGNPLEPDKKYTIRVWDDSGKYNEVFDDISTYKGTEDDLAGFNIEEMFTFGYVTYYNSILNCDLDHTMAITCRLNGIDGSNIRFPGGIIRYHLCDTDENVIRASNEYIYNELNSYIRIFDGVEVDKEYKIEVVSLIEDIDGPDGYEKLCSFFSPTIAIPRNITHFESKEPVQELTNCQVGSAEYTITAEGTFYNGNDPFTGTLQYRIQAVRTDGEIFESAIIQSNSMATLLLPPGDYKVNFLPSYDQSTGRCPLNQSSFSVSLAEFVPSVYEAKYSNFMQCDDREDTGKGEVSIYVKPGTDVKGYSYREFYPNPGSFETIENTPGDSDKDGNGAVLVTISELPIWKNEEKVIYEIRINGECSQNSMRFQLYTPGDIPIRFFGEHPRFQGATDFPEEFYICEGQEDVYLELEQFGKMISLQWQKSIGLDTNGDIIWENVGQLIYDDVNGVENNKLNLSPVAYDELPSGTRFRAIIETAACPGTRIDAEVAVPEVLRILPAPVIESAACRYDGEEFELIAVWDWDKYTEYNSVKLNYIWYRQTTDNLLEEYIKTDENKLTVSQHGVYMVKIEPQYGCESNLSEPFVVSLPIMYWTGAKNDYDWNNIDNWIDEEGNAAQTIPRECTVVHIPGGLSNYPSLLVDDENTQPRYGERFDYPAADIIIYHYGGETAHPHLLKYNQAKIQYNWGYYNNGTLEDGDSYPATLTGRTSVMMARNKWYTLATPLKKMASGDFSLAGYPHTWQSLLNLPNPDNTSELLIETSFSVPFATNNVELVNTYNALGVKVAQYANRIGYNNHRYLDGLKGILEYPYFENKEVEPYRPLHRYSQLTGMSRFYSYNFETLQILNTNIGELKRGNESYRFVFEAEQNQAENIIVKGASVKGYSLNVELSEGGTTQMLIGNPFMATINMGQFYEANADILKDGFSVYEDGSFNSYNYSVNNHVAPLQSFIISLKGENNSYTLLFPLEGSYALTDKSYIGQGKPESFALRVKTSLKNEEDSGTKAILGTTFHPDYTQAVSLSKMIVTDQPETPEAFFIDPDGNGLHALQVIDRSIEAIGLGIKTSNVEEELKLEFENVYNFQMNNLLYPVLEDKEKGVFQDLRNNNIYYFTQQHVTLEEQYADKDRFVIHFVESPVAIEKLKANTINITYINKLLEVNAGKGISRVNIYNMSGVKVFDSGKMIHTPDPYQKYVSLNTGVYLIEVLFENEKPYSQTILIK